MTSKKAKQQALIACPVCGKMYIPFTYYDGYYTGKYCCIQCAIEALHKERLCSQSICKNCGKSFTASRVNVQFCSRECYYQYYSPKEKEKRKNHGT